MNQLPLFTPPTLSVSDLTSYLRNLLLDDELLQDVRVFGEVSNLSQPASGHLYFTLKDASAALRCVMWRSTVQKQKWLPKDGVAIEAHGSIDIYEAGGQYQLYVDRIQPAGEGALYQEFLRLKSRLEAEGLFDAERKKPLPQLSRRIGVVTSPSGAAFQDILNTLQRRYPLVEVILAPTLVQGMEAPTGIVAAINSLVRVASPDVIIIARGGGSIEDLWAFNDERVARTIADCPIPVVTGVGHETDFTIADFCADLRAPTPTAAAEVVTPNKADLLTNLVDLTMRSTQGLQLMIKSRGYELSHINDQLLRLSPLSRLRGDLQHVDELLHRLELGWTHQIQFSRTHIRGLNDRLGAANPTSILNRGYAIVQRLDGEVVRTIQQTRPGEEIDITVSNGQILARTEQTYEK
jgi:exodeoxyribonuclease VII large subunit